MKNFKHGWLIAGGCLIAVGLMANVGRTAYVTDDPRVPSPTYQSTTPVSYFGSGFSTQSTPFSTSSPNMKGLHRRRRRGRKLT